MMSQAGSSGTSSRRHQRTDHDTASLASGRFDPEWESKEALRQRELEEARARAAQMEKTMRWWSDCTANWREKWSKVRNERNKAREEAKVLRTKLEAATKDTTIHKREKQEMYVENERLRKEMDRLQKALLKQMQWRVRERESAIEDDPERDIVPARESETGADAGVAKTKLGAQERGFGSDIEFLEGLFMNGDKSSASVLPIKDKKESGGVCIEEYILQGSVPKHCVERYPSAKEHFIDENDDVLLGDDEELSTSSRPVPSCNSKEAAEQEAESLLAALSEDFQSEQLSLCESQGILADRSDIVGVTDSGGECDRVRSESKRRSSVTEEELSASEVEYLQQKMSMLQLRLEETAKTIQVEREEKIGLHRTIEKLQLEVGALRARCEELRTARQDAVRELLQLQSQHRDQVRSIQLDLQDEANTRQHRDERLADLREELEQLQAENAAEWGKRERLESEKLALERDNKKLRGELREMQERLERRNRPSVVGDVEIRQLQQDLADRTKELAELKHAHSKLKKVLQEKSTELSHAARRSEQYEAEVRRLRGRVEELKRELAAAEDEVDSATNNIRKLQRSNDELQEQVESLQVQVDHLQTRLRNATTTSILTHRSSGLLPGNLSDDDLNEY